MHIFKIGIKIVLWKPNWLCICSVTFPYPTNLPDPSHHCSGTS